MLTSSSNITQDIASDAAAFADQRGQKRFRVLLQASIFPLDSIADVTVHNLSEQGLMAESDVPLAVGQIVHLSFDGATHRSGVVRWTSGRRFGLHLEGYCGAPHPLDEIEANADEDQQPRPVRLSLNIPARAAMVRNLSRSGMLVETTAGLKIGQDLLIKIGRQTPIAAQVRWSQDGRVGIRAEGDQMSQLITE